VHASVGDKGGEVKDSFYEELGRVFDQLPQYDMKIFLGDFNAKVRREDNSKPTIGNESSHEIINDNGVRVVNFFTSKKLKVKLQCSFVATFIKIPAPLLKEKRTTRLITS
jgi:hypothetical protein